MEYEILNRLFSYFLVTYKLLRFSEELVQNREVCYLVVIGSRQMRVGYAVNYSVLPL